MEMTIRHGVLQIWLCAAHVLDGRSIWLVPLKGYKNSFNVKGFILMNMGSDRGQATIKHVRMIFTIIRILTCK